MKIKAVIDRIEDGKYAVLLLEPDEEELVIPLNQLPEGAEPGSWLELMMENGEIGSILLLTEETEQRKQIIAEKMGLLRTRGSSLRRKK